MILVGLDLEIGNPFEEEDGSNRKEENTWITDLAMVVYDTEVGQAPIMTFDTLVNEGKGVSPQAEEYTGITPEMVEKYGIDPKKAAKRCLDILNMADYVVAHNGERADKPWLKHFILRHLENPFEGFKPPVWVDTMTDIEYPNNCVQRNLTYLLGFHGLLNCMAHRALPDTLLMMQLLFKYDVDRVVAIANSPKKRAIAKAPVDSVQNKRPYFTAGTPEYLEMEIWKKKVRKLGFRWDADGTTTGRKCWYKDVREIHINEGITDTFDFEYDLVKL